MKINFAGPEDLSRAMKLGEKNHVFEGQHYTVDAERNTITFHPEYETEQQRFIKALRRSRFAHDYKQICYSTIADPEPEQKYAY